ncbi:MAG: ABC transporter permease [Oscillospiraceae bacterium]|nr:ABC transporter permease [Oscillospiraceae bacterium]
MKHLLRLARKYLMRQKYRTALTFACVLLSVFVFHLVTMAAVLIRGAALGNRIQETGRWQVNIQTWLDNLKEPENAYSVLRSHPKVSDYQIYEYFALNTAAGRDADGMIPFISLEINDVTRNLQRVAVSTMEGDETLSGKMEDLAFGAGSMRFDLKPDEILLPADFTEYGLKEGDTVRITLTPHYGKLHEDADVVSDYVSYLLADHPEFDGIPWFTDSEDASDKTLFGMTLREFMTEMQLMPYAEYSDAVSGTPYTVEMKLVGFFTGGSEYYHTNGTNMQFVTAVNSDFDAAAQLKAAFDSMELPDEAANLIPVRTGGFRVADEAPFDDAVKEIYYAMGFPNDSDLEQDMLHPLNPDDVYNSSLLALEFRGMDAAALWGADLLPVTVALAVAAVLLWALMRFVIENSFEISVQERSAQFAALRVMGASRGQIALLVGFEALFYSLTAVPLGMLLAYACKRVILNVVTRAGVPMTDTSMPLLTLLSFCFAWLAVFISAYTSSMWAARSYTPLEATHRSDLSGTKKQSIWNQQLFGTKSAAEKQAEQQKQMQQAGDLKTPQNAKLNRKRRSFLLHYTLRNIRRTRKRFLIAVVTMTIGCAVFSFGVSAGGWLGMEILQQDGQLAEDFLIEQKGFSAELPEILETTFANDTDFADYRLQIVADSVIDTESFAADFSDLLPAAICNMPAESSTDDGSDMDIIILPRREYEADYESLTGISYDDFTASNSAIICYGTSYSNSLTGVSLEYPAGYHAAEGQMPTVRLESGDTIPVSGVLCSDVPKSGLALLIPIDSADGLLQYLLLRAAYLGQQAIRSEIRLALADSTVYSSGLEKANHFVNDVLSRYRGEVKLTDQFASQTGMKSLASTIGGIALVALLGLWGVGICTMLNTINTGVLNRCDELMTLRQIGMSQIQMRKTVSLEGMVYGAVSTLLGGLLGISGCIYLMQKSTYHGSPVTVFLVLFGAFLVAFAVNLLIAWIAARPGLRELNHRLAAGERL